MGGLNESVRPIENTTRNIAFYSLLPKQDLQLSFEMCFHQYIKKDAPQTMIFILQTHPSKGVQKNMLKEWNFTKNKICYRCFHNNLQKLFRTKILKNSNGHILLKVVLMVGL